MENISVDELIDLLPNKNVIDIRDNYKYNLGFIPGARNVPFEFLTMNPSNYLDKNEKYYVYCDFGNKSKRCVLILKNKGYDIVNIDGGYNAYNAYIHRK